MRGGLRPGQSVTPAGREDGSGTGTGPNEPCWGLSRACSKRQFHSVLQPGTCEGTSLRPPVGLDQHGASQNRQHRPGEQALSPPGPPSAATPEAGLSTFSHLNQSCLLRSNWVGAVLTPAAEGWPTVRTVPPWVQTLHLEVRLQQRADGTLDPEKPGDKGLGPPSVRFIPWAAPATGPRSCRQTAAS